MPDGFSKIASIVGIDPGSNTLGTSIIRYDIETMEIVSTEAKTYVGTRLSKNTWATELHGDRAGRIAGHENNLLRIFNLEQPVYVASESPFFSRLHPQAGGALTEVVCAVKAALHRYDKNQSLQLIDPPTVKKAVGAMGNGDKNAVKKCVLQIPELRYNGKVPMESLDEHSIDAIAVAYYFYKLLKALYENHS